MIKNEKRLFGDIIKEMKNIYLEFGEDKLTEDDDWCIYTIEDELKPDTECYIFDYPDYNDETGEEIFPEYASNNGMECITTCEAIQDVIITALNQNEDLTVEQLIEAINYYFENLTFMEF